MYPEIRRLMRGIRYAAWIAAGAVGQGSVAISGSLRIVTGADSTHFRSLLQLLQSLKAHESRSSVVAYDLGLSDDERMELGSAVSAMPGWEIVRFPFEEYPPYFNIHESAGSYAWKPVIVERELSRTSERYLLWLDAGDMALKTLRGVRRAIQTCGVWSPSSSGTIGEWTHVATVEKFAASERSLARPSLASGIVGFDTESHKARLIAHFWSLAAQNRDWIAPPGSDRSNHRQDQSVLSLIVASLGIRPFPTRTLEIAIHQDAD